MRRFAVETKIMKKRKKEADRIYAGGFGMLIVGKERSLGGFRKHRPFDSCSPSQGCIACECERSRKKSERKRERVEGKIQARRFEKAYQS